MHFYKKLYYILYKPKTYKYFNNEKIDFMNKKIKFLAPVLCGAIVASKNSNIVNAQVQECHMGVEQIDIGHML